MLSAIVLIYIWTLFLNHHRVEQFFWLTALICIFPMTALLRAFHGIKAERIIAKRKKLFAEDDMEVKIKVYNRIFMPTFLPEVVDSLPLIYKLKHRKHENAKGVLPFVFKERELVYKLSDLPRGQLLFGDIYLNKKDLFGLVKIKKVIKSSESILVYPKYINVSTESIVGIKNQQQGGPKQYQTNDTTQISGVREYQHGDKLSLVHWKASAKNSMLMSKEFIPSLNRRSHLILDCYKENENKTNEIFELCVSVAATVTNAFGNSGEPFSVMMNNAHRWEVEKKHKGQFLLEAMEKLALVRNDGNIPLATFCRYNTYRFEKGTSLIIVTTCVDEKLKKYITNLINKKVLVKIYLIGEQSTDTSLPFIHPITSLEQMLPWSEGRKVYEARVK
ncbi:DUF58 domain-containing protein [Proteinivorax hydrogeniformans]|uniref:DUF58 domain-containing protein n=1 Tax=Proteinivorax hydrogeniformans TaxID=1826727 RepID=A0AAU8HSF5_9FIRM